MRILITGGCGFLGAHLIEHFLKNAPGAGIVVLDKLSYASSGFDRLRDIGAYGHPRVTVLCCDLAQPISVGLAREIGAIDFVIHAAAESHVDRSISDPIPFLRSNVIGTHNLLWWAREAKPQHVFVVSTDEVYGPAPWDDLGFDELSRFRPSNPYAATKASAEMLCMAYRNTYGIPVTIVNSMNLMGERQDTEKFIPLVIRRLLVGECVQIHADADRERSGTRHYLHCRNFASALHFLIERVDEIPAEFRKIHVGGEREISNLDLALMIAGAVERPLRYELVSFHASRPGHDLRYALQADMIRALGWQQPMTFNASLSKMIRWYLDNPRWLGL